jgi:hypothetical protein
LIVPFHIKDIPSPLPPKPVKISAKTTGFEFSSEFETGDSCPNACKQKMKITNMFFMALICFKNKQKHRITRYVRLNDYFCGLI